MHTIMRDSAGLRLKVQKHNKFVAFFYGRSELPVAFYILSEVTPVVNNQTEYDARRKCIPDAAADAGRIACDEYGASRTCQ